MKMSDGAAETVGQMKTRHKLQLRNLEKEFRAKIKAAKKKDQKRELKAHQKEAEEVRPFSFLA